MSTDPKTLSVVRNEDGTVTITGLHGIDLGTILTAASLHEHKDAAQANPLDGTHDDGIHESNMFNFQWHQERRLLIDLLIAKLKHAVSPQYNNGDFDHIIRMHQYSINTLEETVREAEAKAALERDGKQPDLIAEATAKIAKALRDADSAMAELNHARSKT